MTNNNNKNTPLTGLFTKHNDTTRFIFTNQTVNLNRYLEDDATQNEEAHLRENDLSKLCPVESREYSKYHIIKLISSRRYKPYAYIE